MAKSTAFFIFLSVVLIIYTSVNFYIFKRSSQALSGTGIYRTVFLTILLSLILAYPVGRFVESFFRNGFVNALIFIGSIYLGLMVYSFLLILIVDVARLGNHFIHFFPTVFSKNPQKTAQITTLVVAGIALLTVGFGHLNALHPRIRTLEINIPKPAGDLKSLNLVMASDIHLGTVIRNSRLMEMVEMINNLEPDLVLLPGDVVDEDVGGLMEQNMTQTLQNIRAPLGVYSITGNHEYIVGVEKALRFLRRGNITVLQDSAVKVNDAFYLIGRKDLMSQRFRNGRASLKDILQNVDGSLPLILMDHQPFHLEMAERHGIDLQISGHTHHGQLFPFNFVTEKVYEKSWGYLRKGNTQYYVSCGLGTWGPPVRTSSRPEIVQMKIKFGE